MTESALVLFSGGQDSTVCLAWALENFDHVETIDRRDVEDVHARAGVLRKQQDPLNRFDFGDDGSRFQVRERIGPSRFAERANGVLQDLIILGVERTAHT